MPPCQRRHFLFLWFVFWDLLLGLIPPHRMFAQTCGKKIKLILQAWSQIPDQNRPQIDMDERKPTWSSCTGGLSDTFSVCWWRCCMSSEGWWALQVFVCIFCGFPSNRRNLWCKQRCIKIKMSQISQETFNVWDIYLSVYAAVVADLVATLHFHRPHLGWMRFTDFCMETLQIEAIKNVL